MKPKQRDSDGDRQLKEIGRTDQASWCGDGIGQLQQSCTSGCNEKDAIGLQYQWDRDQPDDQWIEVKSLEQAKNAITKDSRVLLALGSQHIEIFASRSDVHFIVRMVDSPAQPLPLPDHEIVIGRPGDLRSEKTLLQSKRINLIVCRNSGGFGAYAKIEAARELRLPLIMIGQPENI